mmetsp:Transcript_8422/g.1148  ORF Transcript_8422/g.1148 Transcript_8422/m.1148 type:complete len:86 (-) Transcript_8422:278-535(-)
MEITGPHDLNALDYAVLYGYYNTAYFFYEKGMRPTKTPEEYEEIRSVIKSPYSDFAGILMSLDCNMPPDMVPSFSLPPVEPKEEL